MVFPVFEKFRLHFAVNTKLLIVTLNKKLSESINPNRRTIRSLDWVLQVLWANGDIWNIMEILLWISTFSHPFGTHAGTLRLALIDSLKLMQTCSTMSSRVFIMKRMISLVTSKVNLLHLLNVCSQRFLYLLHLRSTRWRSIVIVVSLTLIEMVVKIRIIQVLYPI